tara:strand:+ start:248 stop:568 length:321 start_codon:yes stop_codon:yes gene_type:complete
MPEIIDWDEMREAWLELPTSKYAWFRTGTRDGFMVQMAIGNLGQVIDYSKALGPYMTAGDLVTVTNTGIEIRSHMTAQPKHRFTTRVVMLVHPFQSPISYPFGEEE